MRKSGLDVGTLQEFGLSWSLRLSLVWEISSVPESVGSLAIPNASMDEVSMTAALADRRSLPFP